MTRHRAARTLKLETGRWETMPETATMPKPVKMKIEAKARARLKQNGQLDLMPEIERAINAAAEKEGVQLTEIRVRYVEHMEQTHMPYLNIGVHTAPGYPPDKAIDAMWKTVYEEVEQVLESRPRAFRKQWGKTVYESMEWGGDDAAAA